MSFVELPISILSVGPQGDQKYYVTVAAPDAQRDISPKEIVGMLRRPLQTGESITADNLMTNREFVDFLHSVIAKHGPSVAGLVNAAKQQGEGWVYIIDGRTPTPQGDVPAEDILGAFEVKNGDISSASYQRFTEHRILSSHGFTRLDSDFLERLLAELSQ